MTTEVVKGDNGGVDGDGNINYNNDGTGRQHVEERSNHSTLGREQRRDLDENRQGHHSSPFASQHHHDNHHARGHHHDHEYDGGHHGHGHGHKNTHGYNHHTHGHYHDDHHASGHHSHHGDNHHE